MRKYSMLLLGCFLILATLLPAAGVFAVPSGEVCEAIDGTTGTTPFTSTGGFKEGDTLTVTDTGAAGTGIELLVDGVSIETADVSGSITYTFTNSSSTKVEVNANSTDGEIEFGCVPKGEEEEDEYDAVEICHYPPGNPYAAHTISVGQAAVQTHLNHGDTEGACPPGVESRSINFAAGMAYFTVEELGILDLYGACAPEGDCILLARVEATQLPLPVAPETDEEGNLIGTLFDEITDDPWTVEVFYLHEHPEQPGVSIYQVNVYEWGVLIDDTLLLMVNEAGELIGWGTHNMWYD